MWRGRNAAGLLSLFVFLTISFGAPKICHGGWIRSGPPAQSLPAAPANPEGIAQQAHLHGAFSHCSSHCKIPESSLQHLMEQGSLCSDGLFVPLPLGLALVQRPRAGLSIPLHLDSRAMAILVDVDLPFSNAPPSS
ncbi:MAG: hypothetical protein KDK25_02040 [Leptospiraceae bacterium]|nr:hypothetical protein [Leptospiraceae bacterium]